MRKESATSKGGTKGEKSKWSGYIWIILCAILLIVWIITHRLVASHEQSHFNENQQLKELYLQTKNLLREFTHHNLTATNPLSTMTHDKTTSLITPDKMDLQTLELLNQCNSNLEATKSELTVCKNVARQKAGTKGEDKWLVIGIPTVARIHDEPYLLRTLESFALQLPTDPDDVLYDKILIIVVNMQVNANENKRHIIFEEAKAKYSNHENPHLSSSFLFLELKKNEIIPDPLPGRNQHNDLGNANVPGFLVRRQTRNIVSVLRKSINRGKYYLFTEDDMILCSQGLFAIQYLLRKSNEYHPNWLAIRTSYGMNGIFMHNSDLDTFAGYLLNHQARRPPDHLVVEWYAGEKPESHTYKGNRANIGFKWNLFDHLGTISTLRSQKAGAMPRCYEMLIEPVVFKVEAYNPHECPHEDIWPCRNVKHKKIPVIDWSSVRQ